MRIRNSMNLGRESNDSQTMTPMIDVVFLLLIFFICASAGQAVEYSLSTELAAGSVESSEPIESPQEAWVTEIKVNLLAPESGKESVIELNGRRLENSNQLKQTLATLSEVSRESPVILDIADDVPMKDMIRVYDLCRSSEFSSIHFAMKRSDLKNSP